MFIVSVDGFCIIGIVLYRSLLLHNYRKDILVYYLCCEKYYKNLGLSVSFMVVSIALCFSFGFGFGCASVVFARRDMIGDRPRQCSVENTAWWI